MSIEIYKADNLTVIAGKGSQLLGASCTEEGEYTEESRQTIRLHISILINGKIKNIFQQYNIVEREGLEKINTDGKTLCLEQYHGFNSLVEILNQLGYETPNFYGILDGAIEKLFND